MWWLDLAAKAGKEIRRDGGGGGGAGGGGKHSTPPSPKN